MRIRYWILILLLAGGILVWRPALRLLRAVYLLLALSGQPEHGLKAVAYEVTVEPWRVEAPRGALEARLYRPRGIERPGIAVLLHGVVPQGMKDSRLVHFARALAGGGTAVLTPDLPDIRRYLLTMATLDDIAAALETAVGSPEASWDRARAGVVGISYSGTLGLLAASRPPLRGKLKYGVTFGSYYSFADAVHFSLTGRYRRAGVEIDMEPHPYARIVFYYNAAPEMASLEEPMRVRRVLELMLDEQVSQAEAARESLTPADRRTVQAMLDGDSEQLNREVEATLSRHPDYLRAFSLEPHLPELRIPHLVLVHSANDDIIPYGETVRLCRRLEPRGDLETRCVVTRLFSHVDVESGVERGFWSFTVPEYSRLIGAIYRVLTLAS
ncbi:MAG TPA: alpha/beta fold hydrolase [Acidobacteriota bacterium]